jgi:C4-dicarboxylate transporter DctQ subunit
MCFRFLQVAWTFLRTGHLPARDHAHVDGVATVEGVDPIQLGREGGPA